jgi:superfamily I DNA and/or RNA helicase
LKLQNLFQVHFEVVHPILVCTYTNVAVDNLVEAFAASGVKPLRVGYGGKIRDSLYKHTLDYNLEQHYLKTEVDKLTKKEDELQTQISALGKKIALLTDAASEAALARKSNMEEAMASKQRVFMAVRSKKYGLCQRMLHDVVNDADVVRLSWPLYPSLIRVLEQICTTCITSACAALNVTDFPLVFLDEASMSTEPASLIPLMKGVRTAHVWLPSNNI